MTTFTLTTTPDFADDPQLAAFDQAWVDLTDDQRSRFGREWAGVLFDLIGDYPFDDDMMDQQPGRIAPRVKGSRTI